MLLGPLGIAVDVLPALPAGGASQGGDGLSAGGRALAVEPVFKKDTEVFGSIWALLVCLLALPSVMFVVSETLPHDNNLIKSQALLWYTHRQAAFGMLLVDVFTDGLADWYSRHTGLSKSLLLMFAGLGTLWLAAAVPGTSVGSVYSMPLAALAS